MKEKILIIGGSGFLGSHVSDEFTNKKFKVTILDKKKSDYLASGQKFLKINTEEKSKLESIIKSFDVIYYFADIADISESKIKYMETINQNIISLSNLLSACLKSKVKKFIYASSLYVYSGSGSFYRATKQCAEILIKEFSRYGNFEYKFLRYGSVYGERSQPWNGIYKFINEIKNSGKVTYQGTGNEIRHYIHVKDAAKLTVKAHQLNIDENAISILGDKPITVDQLFDLIFEICGKKKKVKYLNKINSDDHYGYSPYRFIPEDSIKINSNQSIDLGEGILRLLNSNE